MKESRLIEILENFPEIRIAVIGDFFLDKWLLIDRSLDEPSLETGLTAYQVVEKRNCPGAAGTITNNLAALSIGQIHAIGLIGDDGEGFELKRGLQATGVHTDYLFESDSFFTPTYTKPLFNYASGLEETHRIDIRNRRIIDRDMEYKIIEGLYKAAENADAVIALDQVLDRNTGVITDRVREALAGLAGRKKDLVIYADSRAHTLGFRDIILKCNHLEALAALYLGYQGEPDEKAVCKCAAALSERTGRQVFVTWGVQGLVAAKDGKAVRIPAVKVDGPVDSCGAGDSATAGIVSALCSGATGEEAALIGNLAASITVQQIGTTGTASREDIMKRFKTHIATK
jgi:rfaE bifunctional protein kinase chain/domain